MVDKGRKSGLASSYFPSKRDWWLGLIIWGSILLALAKLIYEQKFSELCIAIPVIILAGWIWFDTGYTITEKELRIKSGPVRSKIALPSIIKISKTRNPLSSPALSLDRLEIKYGRFKTALISPQDKEAFVRAIKARNPRVEIDI